MEAVTAVVSSQILPDAVRDRVPRFSVAMEDTKDFFYEIVEASEPHRPVVVAFDEIMGVPQQLKRSLFAKLRSIFNDRTNPAAPLAACQLQFVFCGSFDPDRVIDDETSPFNVAQTVDTADYDFSIEQVQELAARLSMDVDPTSVHLITGGHPYLTNVVLASLLEGHPLEVVTQAMLQRDGHLAGLGRLLRESGDAVLELALSIRKGQKFSYVPGIDEKLDYLMVIGLVKPDAHGNVTVRSEIYTELLDRMNEHRNLAISGEPTRDQGVSLRRMKVFVASPGDVDEERGRLAKVVEELNRVIARELNVMVELQRWESDVAPDVGRPQGVIFDAIPPESWDIFVGILWLRFGSLSGETDPVTGQVFRSGTEEEFLAAYRRRTNAGDGWPKIMFYRGTRNPATVLYFDDAEKLKQFQHVTQFFSQCRAHGEHPLFVKDYSSVDEFEQLIREHLQRKVFEFAGT
jgi:hypothetical protein